MEPPMSDTEVSADEVRIVVLRAILNAFPYRHLDVEVASRGLSLAALDLRILALKDKGKAD